MDQEMTFSLSYEQLTRFAERRIRECNLDSQGAIYLCESAKAGAVLTERDVSGKQPFVIQRRRSATA